MRTIKFTIPAKEVEVTGCNTCPYLGTDGGGLGQIWICNHPKFKGYEGAIIDNQHLNEFPEKCPVLPENKDRPVDKAPVGEFVKVSITKREHLLAAKILTPYGGFMNKNNALVLAEIVGDGQRYARTASGDCWMIQDKGDCGTVRPGTSSGCGLQRQARVTAKQ